MPAEILFCGVKHTPRPWVAEKKGAWWVTSANGEICEIMPWSNECDTADAYLIAAAPDLLESLEALEYQLAGETDAVKKRFADVRAKGRAAIAKAKGGEA